MHRLSQGSWKDRWTCSLEPLAALASASLQPSPLHSSRSQGTNHNEDNIIMCFIFESSFKSIKNKIAFLTSVTCFEIIQDLLWGEGKEQIVDTKRLAMSQ